MIKKAFSKAIALSFALLLLTFSCQRENILVENGDQNPRVQNSENYEFVPMDLERTQSYLEELINYDQADASQDFNKIYVDEQKVRVDAYWNSETDQYEVRETEVQDAFNELVSLAQSAADRNNFLEMAHTMVLCDIGEPTMVGELPGGGVFEFAANYVFAIFILDWKCSFGPNDYWLHGYDFGGCGPNNATTSDAAEEIQMLVNNSPCKPTSYCRWYKNISFQDIFASTLNANDPVPGDYYLDYYTYLGPPNGSGCLNPTEMNFYKNGCGIESAIRLNQIGLSSHHVLAYDLEGDYVASQPTITTRFWHGECSVLAPTP